jgi:hypothetical protein
VPPRGRPRRHIGTPLTRAADEQLVGDEGPGPAQGGARGAAALGPKILVLGLISN